MPRRLISRQQLKPAVRIRETRLVAVTTRVLRGLQSLLTTHELQVAAAMGSLHGGQLEARVAGIWARHRPELRAALEDPVRVYKDAGDDPFAELAPDASLAEAQIGVLIQQLTPAQLTAVRAQLQALMELGPTPDVLQGIAGATGLTTRQVGQVTALIERQQAAGLAPGVIERTAKGLADTLLRQRAGTIARHEAVTYTNALVHARGDQLAAAGHPITKAWVSARDAHVDFGNRSGICRVLDNGERIPLDQPWVFNGQQYMTPPGHIGCRCLEEIWDEAA